MNPASDKPNRPLADRLRPETFEDFVGQSHLLGSDKILRNILRSGHLPSLILWGPPGSGKTTLAGLLADKFEARFVEMSAVLNGVADIREAVDNAEKSGPLFDKQTVLFVDEVHRFDKGQQDALLPPVEKGTVTLIGATTENPSFEINSALLSRCQVLVLEALDDADLRELVDRALRDERRGLGSLDLSIDDSARTRLIQSSNGDARVVLNTLEMAARAVASEDRATISAADIDEALNQSPVDYDKAGSKHYQLASAFIKSMRGSDPDAAVYYMSRMLEGGEDPLFILRRMLIFASEDIGNADPNALQVATSAMQAFQCIGLPEGTLPMTQAAIYLATAPKSNTVIESYARARKAVKQHGDLDIPDHIVNAPTDLNEKLGHGRGYKYPHNFTGHYVPEQYLPKNLRGESLVELSDQGYEQKIQAYLDSLESDS